MLGLLSVIECFHALPFVVLRVSAARSVVLGDLTFFEWDLDFLRPRSQQRRISLFLNSMALLQQNELLLRREQEKQALIATTRNNHSREGYEFVAKVKLEARAGK